jgi:hypothetical protein
MVGGDMVGAELWEYLLRFWGDKLMGREVSYEGEKKVEIGMDGADAAPAGRPPQLAKSTAFRAGKKSIFYVPPSSEQNTKHY